jgi:hypothetical protein
VVLSNHIPSLLAYIMWSVCVCTGLNGPYYCNLNAFLSWNLHIVNSFCARFLWFRVRKCQRMYIYISVVERVNLDCCLYNILRRKHWTVQEYHSPFLYHICITSCCGILARGNITATVATWLLVVYNAMVCMILLKLKVGQSVLQHCKARVHQTGCLS